MNDFPSLDDVRAARERIRPHVRATPVVGDDGLTYKFEFLQHTGSFKPRGAFNAALQLDAAARARGLVTVSGGNHGMALAYVGEALHVPVTVFMPSTTPRYVTDYVRERGAEVRLAETMAEAFAGCRAGADAGSTLLHPFDDAAVIAGQATLGLEMLEQHPAVRRVLISIGGGGLIAGIAFAIKQLRPEVEIVGVETRGADAMHRALGAGRIVEMPAITSIARTLAAPAVCERTLEATRRYVDEVVVVDDRDAVAAIGELQERLGVTVEPAAACTLAALRTGAVAAKPETLLLLCGRNVRLEEIAAWNVRFANATT